MRIESILIKDVRSQTYYVVIGDTLEPRTIPLCLTEFLYVVLTDEEYKEYTEPFLNQLNQKTDTLNIKDSRYSFFKQMVHDSRCGLRYDNFNNSSKELKSLITSSKSNDSIKEYVLGINSTKFKPIAFYKNPGSFYDKLVEINSENQNQNQPMDDLPF